MLFAPDHDPDVDPRDAIAIVHKFLSQCQEWAIKQELPKTQQALLEKPDAAAAARHYQWCTYLEFTDHALQELEVGTLDKWFLQKTRTDE